MSTAHSLIASRLKQKRERNIRKVFINHLKSRPCVDCGGQYPPCVMDFDHKDPKRKKFEVSRMLEHSKEAILDEVAKCDLVCSNCHRVRTDKRRKRRENKN